jgi:hypothetical protein
MGIAVVWRHPCDDTAVSLSSMDQRPPPDPSKLLAYWREWERGETPPGRTISNLKIAGLPDLLQALIDGGWTPSAATGDGTNTDEAASTQGA